MFSVEFSIGWPNGRRSETCDWSIDFTKAQVGEAQRPVQDRSAAVQNRHKPSAVFIRAFWKALGRVDHAVNVREMSAGQSDLRIRATNTGR